jgi:tetratricopeptide (TPR) repeat protein
MRKILNVIIFSLIVITTFSQEESLKELALKEFKNEHYDEAIDLLEKALTKESNDAEIYYYLGWFNHYRAYDSRPLNGYDYTYSERIFGYLKKAIELNPNYGDAKYFYGAECSGNAFLAMQNCEPEKMKYFFELAYNVGAYPDWLIEFGKNFLSSCENDAILFTGGNADFDVCSYLQLCENYRTDITLIPIGNIDRPWYVSFLKKGLKGCVPNININLSEQQIMDIHPFKWKETDILINVSQRDKKKFNLFDDYKLVWKVRPDLQSERMHSKIDSETAQKRVYLSPQRAMLLQIVEDNFSERPIYFSNFANNSFYGGLDEFFQNCGLVSKLTPIKTSNSNFEFDKSQLEKLLTSQSLKHYEDIKKNDIPRISGVIMYGYNRLFLNLANIYSKAEDEQKIEELAKLYEKNMKINFNFDLEERLMKELVTLGKPN